MIDAAIGWGILALLALAAAGVAWAGDRAGRWIEAGDQEGGKDDEA